MTNLSRTATFIGILIGVFFVFFSLTVSATQISQLHPSSEQFQEGSLLTLSPDDSQVLQLAHINSDRALLGVAGTTTNATVELGSDINDRSGVLVVSSGNAYVLVTDLEGPVNKGDQIGLSRVEGVGGHIDELTNTYSIGTALADFESDDPAVRSVEADGQTINVGLLPVDIHIGASPASISYSSGGSLLQYAGQLIIGREVGVTRVVLALAAFLGSIIAGSVLLFGAIRGGFVSLGRNPLASESITRQLVKISSFSILIVFLGVAVSYGVLAV